MEQSAAAIELSTVRFSVKHAWSAAATYINMQICEWLSSASKHAIMNECNLHCVLQARFMSVLDHGIECPAALQAKHSRPEHSTARFAVLVMLHNAGFPNHLFWERWVDTHPAGDVALVVHMKVRLGSAARCLVS